MTTKRPEFNAHDDFIFEHKEVGKVTREEFIKYVRSSHEHMRKLSQIIQQYDKTLGGDFEDLLNEWLQDGTMDHIINENLMSGKADKSYVEELHETTNTQLALKADKTYVDELNTAIENIDIPDVDLTDYATLNYVNTAIENIDMPDVDLTNYATLNYVEDLHDYTTTQLAQTEASLIALNHRSTHISILEHIEDGGGELDITSVLKNLINTLPENTTIYLPARTSDYVLNEKIVIDRQIFIKGDYSGRNSGTVIKATGDGGFEVRTPYLPIDGIDLYGVKDGTFEHRGHLGTIGIDMTVSSWASGGLHGHGVKVRGFNIGIAMRPVDDGTWAGAHRNFYNWNIRDNEVGVYAIDGATQENFFGGQITNNTVHGVFTENEMYYSNLEFIGTVLEANGTRNITDMDYKEHGIYAGAHAKVKLTSAYLEKINVFASDGGMVLMVNTHINDDVSMYAVRGGDVDIGNSVGTYEATRTFSSGDQLRDAMLFNTGVTSGGSYPSISINMVGDASELVRSKPSWFMNRGVPIQNIQRIKIRFKFKVDSDGSGEPFMVRPYINGENSNDLGDPTLASIPKNLYTFPQGEEVEYMFYYKPRVASGYLSASDTFKDLQLYLSFPGDKSVKPFKATLSDVFIKAHSTSPLSLNDPTYTSK